AEKPPATPIGRARRLIVQRFKVIVALVVVALLGWGMHRVWQHFEPQISQRESYLLAEQRITITALPEWITGEVRSEAIRNAGIIGRLSVLDDAFAQVIEDAFVLHPWVESVERITKRYPAGAHVELTYRRPIAAVELVNQNVVQLIPIDRFGVHLPSSDVPNIRKRYLPRIGGVVERPPVGQPWTDPRVLGAAEIAEQLAPVWESMHLVDILPSARPEIRGRMRYFVFDLITRGGTRVVWGAAPSAAPPSEDKFAEKLDRLRAVAKQYGPLDSVRGPAVVDIRKNELTITPRTVKKKKRVAKKNDAETQSK
ncbi:MAG: cell division protein FtsQ/DivIB, partial [Bythopirellula sp.]